MVEEPKASTSKAPKASTSKKVVEAEVDSDDDDARSSDDEDDDMEVDENFRNELLAALQANGVADEFDAKDSDDGEESEEELLDDDQMMAMDEKLADIFRLQGGGRKGKKSKCVDLLTCDRRADIILMYLSSRENRRYTLQASCCRSHRIPIQTQIFKLSSRSRRPPTFQHRSKFI